MTWHPARRLPDTRPRAAEHLTVCDCLRCDCAVPVARAGAVCWACTSGARCLELNKLRVELQAESDRLGLGSIG